RYLPSFPTRRSSDLYKSGTAPTARLINMPGKLNGGDVSKLSALDEVGCSVIVYATATLGTDLNNFLRCLDDFQCLAVVLHRFGKDRKSTRLNSSHVK